MEIIKWSKEYHEDIGEEDENGYFMYEYRYFIYHFYLPDKRLVRARQYTDTITECSFYFYSADNQWIKKPDDKLLKYLPCIVGFMTRKQGVKKLLYFNGSYAPLIVKEKGCSATISLVEIAAVQ